MNKRLKNFLRDFLRKVLGVRLYIYIRFVITHRYIPNLREPKTWNEKIQYRKLNVPPTDYSKYVDKYSVREFVEKTIGSDHLIPLLGKFEVLSPADFDLLPNQFVLKTSNGGGGENVKIVFNKNEEDINELCDLFNEYVKENIGSKIDEPFYDIEKSYILVEKLIVDKDNTLPSDYKFHVFNGDSQKIFVQVDRGRFYEHKRSIYSIQGNKQSFKIQPKYLDIEDEYTFPDGFDYMLNKAITLAQSFDYVRVDMYLVDGLTLFGELTFCHGSGWEPVFPRKYDGYLGSCWKLSRYET